MMFFNLSLRGADYPYWSVATIHTRFSGSARWISSGSRSKWEKSFSMRLTANTTDSLPPREATDSDRH